MAKTTETTITIVASAKGGVGKTTVAHLRIARFQLLNGGRLPVIVEVESEPRLAPIFGEAVSFFPFEMDPARLEADPSVAYATWDRVADVVKKAKADVIIDVGANLVSALATYLAEAGDYTAFGRGDNVVVLAVATGETKAVNSARTALFQLRAALPNARRYFVLNDRDVRLFPLDPESAGVKDIVAETGAAGVLRVPCCTSGAFAEMTDRDMALVDAVKHEADYWERECGLAGPAAARAAHRLRVFLNEGCNAFDAIHGPMKVADARPVPAA